MFSTSQECSIYHSHQHEWGSLGDFSDEDYTLFVLISPISSRYSKTVQQMNASRGGFKRESKMQPNSRVKEHLQGIVFFSDGILTYTICFFCPLKKLLALILNSFTYPLTGLRNILTQVNNTYWDSMGQRAS